MKHKTLTLALFSVLSIANVAHAENQTVTLGYAQSDVQDFGNIRGVNLKYRYEWDSSLSIITSFTYMGGNDDRTYNAASDIIHRKTKAKYYTLSAGPAWRLNQFVSVYGLVGVNYSKISYNYNWLNACGDGSTCTDMGNFSGKSNSTNVMYGAGVQFNVWQDATLDIAYEGTSISADDKNHSINGFNIGVGYRF